MIDTNNDFFIKVKLNFPDLRRYTFVVIALFLLIFLCYGNSFDCSWHFDDYDNIVDNSRIRLENFSWHEINESFLGIIGVDRWSRPLSYFSFAINYHFSGRNVFGYHVVNFIIHYLSSIFLFFFIYNILKLPILNNRYASNAYSIALLATVLWAIHPIQVTAVTYIVQRMASMAAMFYIMSMLFYLKGRTSESLRKGILFFILSAFSALLSIGTKENAAMLPVSLLLFDLFLIQGITKENLKKNAKIFIIPALAVLVIGLLFFGNISAIIGDYSTRPFTMMERVLTQPRVILFYISLLLYPITSRFMLIHDIQISKSFLEPWTTSAAILVIVLMLSIAVWKARKRPLISFCIIFFFLNHLIEGSFISLELIFEHRNYLPSMLLFVPISMLMVYGMNYFAFRKRMLIIVASAITSIIFLQGITVYIQNNILKDEISTWSWNVEKTPNLHHPRQNLAVAYMMAGQLEESYKELNTALECELSANVEKMCLTDLCIGEYYFLTGDDNKALMQFEKISERYPSYTAYDSFARTYFRIAQIKFRKGLFDEAEESVKKAISLNPKIPDFHITLSSILLKQGYPDKAIKEAQKALRLNGDCREAYLIFAEVFKGKKDYTTAEHFYKLATGKSLTSRLMQSTNNRICNEGTLVVVN